MVHVNVQDKVTGINAREKTLKKTIYKRMRKNKENKETTTRCQSAYNRHIPLLLIIALTGPHHTGVMLVPKINNLLGICSPLHNELR